MTVVTIGKTRLALIQGDITEQSTDAIVNAANSSLMGGGGVDGAIHRKGGPSILKECEKIRRTEWREGLPTGEAVITPGGELKARWVIHTVGPIWNGGRSGEPEMLANCYRNSLKLANSKALASISFPSISTGAFGYPIRDAGRIAIDSVKNFVREHADETTMEDVVLVLFTQDDFKIYNELLEPD
jgi:O-acetyl-ADP-ribose deacetylase